MSNSVSADEQAIRQIDAAWSRALQNKDLDGVMINYADDASFLPPDEPIVQGAAKIREWFAQRVTLPGFSASFIPNTIKVAKSRDIAYELGTFRATINDDSGQLIAYSGKHLVTWENRDGHWKVTAESVNRDQLLTSRAQS